jgi:hypothetical protein
MTERQKKYLIIGIGLPLVCACFYFSLDSWPPTPKDWARTAFIVVGVFVLGEFRRRERAKDECEQAGCRTTPY